MSALSELLHGPGCNHRWSNTIQMGSSPWKKRILQGITSLWALQYCELCGDLVDLRQDQVLVLINRHSPTMNLVKEKQRRLIPPGLQSRPWSISPTLLVRPSQILTLFCLAWLLS